MAVGFGNTLDDAVRDHDRNLDAFLPTCTARGIKLNAEKVLFRLRKVPFIGQIVTDRGLCVDPVKASAISEMPHIQPNTVFARNGAIPLASFFPISQI